MLELGEDLLDWIEVWAVGRQEDHVCANTADRSSGCRSFVGAEVVEDDDVTLGKGRHKNVLDVDGEHIAVDGAVDNPWRIDAVMAESGDEGQRLPMAMGDMGFQPMPPWSPSTQRRHVCLDPRLIEEDKALGINLVLVRFPARPFAGDIRTRLFRRQHGFF